MNKEQIIDEAYENYKTIRKHAIRTEGNGSQLAIESLEKQLIYPQEKFINKIKTDDEFAKWWGLKIEERELSRLERISIAIEKKLTHKTAHLTKDFDYQKWCDEQNIPTKLITITYNNETIESYE